MYHVNVYNVSLADHGASASLRRPAEHRGSGPRPGHGAAAGGGAEGGAGGGAGHQPADGALQPQAAVPQLRRRPPGGLRPRAAAGRGGGHGDRGGEERDGQRPALHRRGGQRAQDPGHPSAAPVRRRGGEAHPSPCSMAYGRHALGAYCAPFW